MSVQKIIRPDFEKMRGEVPVILQDVANNKIISVALTNEKGYLEVLRTGTANLFIGEGQEHLFYVYAIHINVSGTVLIYKVSAAIKETPAGFQHKTDFNQSVINLKEPVMPSLSGPAGKSRLIETEVCMQIFCDFPGLSFDKKLE